MITELKMTIDSRDLDFYFQNCHQCLVIACTLELELIVRLSIMNILIWQKPLSLMR